MTAREVTAYTLRTCDACRKAVRALEAGGWTVRAVDVRADGLPPGALGKVADSVGWEALLNTRSATWRGLDEAARARARSGREGALAAIAAHPTLMKRPVLVAGDAVHVGWRRDVHEALLGG